MSTEGIDRAPAWRHPALPSRRGAWRRLGAAALAMWALAAGAQQAPSAQPAAAASKPGGGTAATVKVQMRTSMGEIQLELDAAKAPLTVRNFVEYARAGHYDGTIFHRVIPNFMIQGGGFTADMQQKPTREPIKLESNNGLKNLRGTIAMARTNVPDSATSQFFINVVDNEFLNYRKYEADTVVQTSRGPQTVPAGTVVDGYAVFGKVTSGMDVVDKIRNVATEPRAGGHANVPKEPVVIQSVKVLN
jgi:peptidyl-prolyl cis-trans isomerase A (cyclophilin A)